MNETPGRVRAVAVVALAGDGVLAASSRRAAFAIGAGQKPDAAIDAALRSLLGRVADGAAQVGDADVADLHRRGFGDDELFEAVVATAVGAGCARLDAGLAALERACD